jgi:hypothetical protein
MRRIVRRHRVFWIGLLKRRGSDERGLVIYDPKNQLRVMSDNYVTLFELAEMQAGEFRKEVVRGLIEQVDEFSDTEVEAALNKYLQVAGIDIEEEWKQREAERQVYWPGRDENHCWNCFQAVDYETSPRCITRCGWVKCSCGSCLCNMPLSRRLKKPYTVIVTYIREAACCCPVCEGVCFIASEQEQRRREAEGVTYRPDASEYSSCTKCRGKGYLTLGELAT